MTYTIRFSQEANEDIEDIYNYIEENIDTQSARRQMIEIIDKIEGLNEFPYRHPKYEVNDPDLLTRNLHGFPLGRYMVLYDVEKTNHVVTISRIIHGARDIEALLQETN
ncbi:MAG: type II toxin-antitoxin system RelE/ParE family toxin [Coprobacillus sp.]|nr:type II toxin-antitoxin system RelE/ParE family toxin [Coprobacillus sp.]